MNAKEVDEVERMRKIAFSKKENFGVDAKYWFETITTKINLLKETEDEISLKMDSRTTEIKTKADNTLLFYIISTVVILVIAIFLAFLITKNILQQLGGEPSIVVDLAIKISKGDLTATFESDKEAIGLFGAMKDMSDKLKEVIVAVKVTSDNFVTATQQISSTSQQMSQGSSEQASSAEEVSSSMEQMAANIQQNADNSQQTEKITLLSSESVKNGAETSIIAVKSMNEIAEKIQIVNDIALQTNILALNAAV